MAAGEKILRDRLKSVRNTQKITKAMKLVSAAKLRKAQDAVTRSRDYTEALNQLLSELSAELSGLEIQHPLMERRSDVRRVALIVIGGSRGLCGSYNSNVNKNTEAFLREYGAAGNATRGATPVDLFLVGRKPAEYARRLRRDAVQTWEELSEDANLWPIEEMVRAIETRFVAGEVDEVHVLFSKFRSAISIKPTLLKLLPMDPALTQKSTGGTESGSTLFEPSVTALFAGLMPRILRTQFRQACLDAKASEHGSRMTAMESATKNAGELAQKLQLTYNKKRQEGITAQLLDIVGGAEAMK